MHNRYEPVTLDEWIELHPSEEDLRTVFLNLDMALKYIHDHGYCVYIFYPSKIEILDNKPDHIRFRHLMELSKDPVRRKEMIKEDIFNSSFIQIGIYSNSLKYLKPDFLRENFDSFIQFIPSTDVPYYRGVIQRGAAVYFCEFAFEQKKRDYAALESQVADDGNSPSRQMVKSNGAFFGVEPVTPIIPFTNDKVNDSIYRQINGLKDTAFVYSLIIPTVVFLTLFLFGLLAWLMSIFA